MTSLEPGIWNLGDMFDAVALVVPPEREAIVQGDRVLCWRDLTLRTNRVARALLAGGLQYGDRVAFVSRNHAAYIETVVACQKARLVHVNVNYRYQPDEIAHVLADSGARAVLFQSEFEPAMTALRPRFPGMALWIRADGPAGGAANASFEHMAGTGDGSPLGIVRSPDDQFLMYTGGTTGKPKGVLWRVHDMRATQLESPAVLRRPRDIPEHVEMARQNPSPGRVMPACPLMHGAGINSAVAELVSGGTTVLLESPGFDAGEVWATVACRRVTRILIVGDVFARPMLKALDDNPGKYDLSSLRVISSSGLMWSQDIKRRLLAHLPNVLLLDIYGASEASGLGYSSTSATKTVPTGLFEPGPKTVLVTVDDEVLGPDQPGEGMVARSGPMSLGYFGDPVKTAELFREIGGVRYGLPGDWARREPSGLMTLIGRGNACINTGGEKVFAEEVEEILKLQDGVEDALVVGVPDETWGKAIVALVKTRPGATLEDEHVRGGMRQHLANYKIPKTFLTVAAVPRSESGKADYARANALARKLLGQG